MVQNEDNMIGGFVAINTGIITNSYADTLLDSSSRLATFCFQNTGKLKRVFSKKGSKKKNYIKFCKQNNGLITDYFWYNPIKNTFNHEYMDITQSEKLTPLMLKEKYQWNFVNVWKEVENLKDLSFDMNYFFEIKENGEKAIHITSEQDLIHFAKNVNAGKEEYKHAHVVLRCDIDLKGKKWEPIGLNENCAFHGSFDGQGHTIQNFKVEGKTYEYAGFFGYLKGAQIANLHIDCIVGGTRYVGSMAGVNDGGVIYSTYATCRVHEGKFTGGFVAKNTGEIHKCFVEGKINKKLIIFPIIFGLILLFLILFLLIKFLFPKTEDVYKPVVIDPNVIKDDQESEVTTSGNVNKASFDFSQEIIIDYDTMVGSFDFRNPTRGNHDIVISVMISDEELKNKLGKTGRSESDQKQLEKSSDYQAQTQYTVLYKSGLIQRGYVLPVIQLASLDDGTKLPRGNYQAMVKLEFYNSDTNEKAIMSSNLPVEITIQ